MEFKHLLNGEAVKAGTFERIMFFLRGSLYSYKSLFAWLVPQIYILTKIVSPLFQILFFTFMGRYFAGDLGAAFFIIGNAVQVSAISSIDGTAMTIASERAEGTLIQLLGTPASRARIFLSRTLMHIFDGLFTVAICFLFGFLFLGVNFNNTNFLFLIATLLITIFSTCGLGTLIGSFGLAMREVNLLSNLTYYMLLILCGINYPVTRLPIFIQKISYALPLTRGVEAVRQIIAGAGFDKISYLLYGEIVVGITYMALGFLFFKFLDFYSKRTGSIDMY